ncbi:MAG: acyloxyacyl hydrolase [Phycisphaerae bacterium]|nr:acyloxyacyl hydrolase [Phycisphaerae bacterium]
MKRRPPWCGSPLARVLAVGLVAAWAGASAAGADEPAPLALDLSESYVAQARAERAAAADQGREAPPGARTPFGIAGGQWLSFGVGYGNDFKSNNSYNARAGISWFLADDVQFEVNLNGWYFDQKGDDTGGINPDFFFRWHFWAAENHDWTVYADVGIGLLFAFDNVPDRGTGFNFTPGAGVGFTTRLGEGENRLQVGVRWAHISNGRISGDERNPARDSIMPYVAIVIPF